MEKRNIRKKGYNKTNIVAFIACLGVITVILTVLLANYFFNKSFEHSSEESSIASSTSEEEKSVESADVSEEISKITEVSEETSQIPSVPMKSLILDDDEVHKGNLIIINDDKQFVFGSEPVLERVSDSEYKTSNYHLKDMSLFLSKEIMLPLKKMTDDLAAYTEKTSFTLTSTYRDRAKQQSLYDEKKDSDIPGGSEFHSGVSFQCTVYPSSDGAIGEGKYLWLEDNCYYYGFVLRYPEGKKSITKHDESNSIFRYVGEPHAYLMNLNKYCLEEYVEFCRMYSSENPYKFTYEEKEYWIYFVGLSASGNTTVTVPEGKSYSISGDNYSGYIVTVNMSEDIE